MKTNKKEEKENPVPVPPAGPLIRQILIETDGNNIKVVKAEVTGRIELMAILQSVITFFGQERQE